MTPRSTRVSDHRRERTTAQLAVLADRLKATEQRQQHLQNTLAGLAREVGVSVGCVCGHCDESHTLIKDGTMYCPRCGYRRSV